MTEPTRTACAGMPDLWESTDHCPFFDAGGGGMSNCQVCGRSMPTKRGGRGLPKLYCSDLCAGRADYNRLKADPERAARRRARDRWASMMKRCYDPLNNRWNRYGGRGITVCDRWRDFNAYYADTGDAPTGMTLDRINNNGPYSPDNTRWATAVQQRANQEYDPMRIKTHCAQGHPFDEVNTHVDTGGWRSCRACARAKTARRRAAKKVS